MQIVERFVLARPRNRQFFSLDELNAAIRECAAELNVKIMRKVGKSRRELLETIEHLKYTPTTATPAQRWEPVPVTRALLKSQRYAKNHPFQGSSEKCPLRLRRRRRNQS